MSPRKKRCPTPDKISFRSQVDAMIKAKRAGDWHGQPLRVYKCKCGRWHTTSQLKETLDSEA